MKFIIALPAYNEQQILENNVCVDPPQEVQQEVEEVVEPPVEEVVEEPESPESEAPAEGVTP